MAKTVTSTRKLSTTTKDVLDRYDSFWTYTKQNHHPRFDRNWKLYNNQRTAESYKGITNTFVPMPFSIIETATSALTAGRPSIDFVPQDMYQFIMAYQRTGRKPDLKALNSMFDYYWDCDNWDLKTIKTVRSTFLYGIASEWVYWDGDKPRVINMGPRDAIIDPTLTDPMQLVVSPDEFFTGRRYLTTLKALSEERIVDPENPGKTRPRFSNLHLVKPGTTSKDQGDKEFKEMYLGSLTGSKDMVEVIEIWDGQKIRSVAQRSIDIENRNNELGIHCMSINRFIADESLIYGKSLLDPVAAQVEYLNDLSNQRLDAITDILNPQWELDPIYADKTNQVTNAFGTVYPFTPGSLQPIRKQPVDSSAFNEASNIKNEIREAVGVDQIVQGVAEDSNATATEINAQLSQAGQRFTLFVRMLEREGLYHRAKIVYKMMRYYQRDMQLVPTMGVNGPQFFTYDPSQYTDDYEPKIQLESSVKNKKRSEQATALEAFQAIIADPTNDLYEAKKILYPKMFDMKEEELDRIIGQQKPEEELAMGAPAGPGDMPAGMEMQEQIPEVPMDSAELPV